MLRLRCAALSITCLLQVLTSKHPSRQAFVYSLRIATARVQPTLPALILVGKQATLKPKGGSWSRLASFLIWQYSLSRPT